MVSLQQLLQLMIVDDDDDNDHDDDRERNDIDNDDDIDWPVGWLVVSISGGGRICRPMPTD